MKQDEKDDGNFTMDFFTITTQYQNLRGTLPDKTTKTKQKSIDEHTVMCKNAAIHWEHYIPDILNKS